VRRLLVVLMFGLGAVFSGCGGGGGPGQDSGSGSSLSGLMPSAPALGGVLHSDARVLRPMRPASRWSYRGTLREGAHALGVGYTNEVFHEPGSTNGAVREISSNSFNTGSDAIEYLTGPNAVTSYQKIDFGGGVVDSISAPELRSPVRAGDQYLVYDRRVENSGLDVDKDGKVDWLNIAVYRRVIGNEQVELSALGAVEAVRVDQVMLFRFTLSNSGTYTPIATIRQSDWYAPGVGVVKRRREHPLNAAGSELSVAVEELTKWDGGIEGWGALSPAVLTPPSGPAAGLHLTYPIAAVALDHHVVVASRPPQSMSDGIAFTRLDARASAAETIVHTGPDAAHLVSGTFVGLGQQIAVLVDDRTSLGKRIVGFDSRGAPIADLRGTRLELGPDDVTNGQQTVWAAASDGTRLWVLWSRLPPLNAQSPSRLLIRAFDVDGTPLSEEYQLDEAQDALAFSTSLRLTGGGGRVLVTWGRLAETGAIEYRYGLISTSDGALRTGTLVSGAFDRHLRVYPLASSNVSALVWFNRLRNDTPQFSGIHGVTISSNGTPVRANPSEAIDTEVLSEQWRPAPLGPGLATATSGWIDLFYGGSHQGWFEEHRERPLNVMARIKADVGDLKAHSTQARFVRWEPDYLTTRLQVSLGDRVIHVGTLNHDDGPVSTRLIWLR